MQRFKGRTAIVTGSARGLGECIARRFAAEGANVVINYVQSRERAQALVNDLENKGQKAHLIQADVSDSTAANKLVDAAIQKYGRLDILVNNAGLILDKPFTEHTDEDFDQIIKTMLYGTFFVSRAAVPHMVAQGHGRILAQASIVMDKFDFGGAKMSACAAAKAGIVAMLRSLADEIAQTGVTVNAVAPGIVETEMFANMPPESLRRQRGLFQCAASANPKKLQVRWRFSLRMKHHTLLVRCSA